MSARPKIPPVDPSTARPDISAMLLAGSEATGGASNVAGTLANNPGLFRRVMPLAGKLLNAGKLSPRDRELAILRTAQQCGCEYEWLHHVRIGKQIGLSDEEIQAVAVGPHHLLWSDHDRAVLSATDQLIVDHRVADATYDQLALGLTIEQIIEMLILVGNYAMIAGFLNSLNVVHDDGDATG